MTISISPHIYVQHPIVVLRIGGLAIQDAVLPIGSVSTLHRAARCLREDYGRRRVELCDAIGAALPLAYDEGQGTGRLLLGLKRSFFNSRTPAQAALIVADRLLDASDRQMIIEATAILEQIADLEGRIDEEYRDGIAEASEHALSIVCEHGISRAIELTNPDTHRRLKAFHASATSFSKKEQNLLYTTAARYVLRAGQKTSPLSSMGIVALGSWNGTGDPTKSGAVLDVRGVTEHVVQFRHAALQSVAAQLQRTFADLGDHARIVLNPSLKIDGDSSSWRKVVRDDPPETRVRGTRIERNTSDAAFIRLLQRLLAYAPQGGATTIQDLQLALAKALPGLTVGGRTALLETAWQSDLLRIDTGNAADAVGHLQRSIASLADPERRSLLGRNVDQMMDALLAPLRTISNHVIDSRFSALLEAASITEPITRYRPVLFEDCRISESEFELPPTWQKQIRPALEPVLDLVPILTADSPLHRIRRIIVGRFVEAFGLGGACADSLAFLTDSADHLDALFDPARASEADPQRFSAPLDDVHAAMLELQRSLFRYLTDRVLDGNRGTAEVRIDAEDLAPYSQAIPPSGWPRELSQMFFVQPCLIHDEQYFVLNQIYPGASSTFSRFIPDAPERKQMVRAYLSDLAAGRPFVELSGEFGFNAASRPNFADDRVSAAPFGQPGDGTIPLDRFGLRHRTESDDLVFVSPEGHDTSIFYPAILTPFLTPRIHQTVRITASWTELVADISGNLLAKLDGDPDGIKRLPRIFVGDLVIARRTFAVPRSALPDPLATDVLFYRMFADWADENDLPRWLFVRRAAPAGLLDGAPRSPRRGAGKPLPLDRDCPLSVRIFQKDLAVSGSDVVLTEALPSPNGMQVRHNGRQTVTELGIELSRIIERNEG